MQLYQILMPLAGIVCFIAAVILWLDSDFLYGIEMRIKKLHRDRKVRKAAETLRRYGGDQNDGYGI